MLPYIIVWYVHKYDKKKLLKSVFTTVAVHFQDTGD